MFYHNRAPRILLEFLDRVRPEEYYEIPEGEPLPQAILPGLILMFCSGAGAIFFGVGGLLGVLSLNQDNIIIRLNTKSFKEVTEVMKI